MSLDRASRRDEPLDCTECGGDAEGNVHWTDGSGEICDACDAELEANS